MNQEIRRLDDSQLPPDLKVQIARCLKLLQLQKHPGIRVIRSINNASGTVELDIDSFGDRTFQQWVETQQSPGLRLLETLAQIVTAVVMAHRFGLVHGNLNGQSIGHAKPQSLLCLQVALQCCNPLLHANMCLRPQNTARIRRAQRSQAFHRTNSSQAHVWAGSSLNRSWEKEGWARFSGSETSPTQQLQPLKC